jgi:hypothetical protein
MAEASLLRRKPLEQSRHALGEGRVGRHGDQLLLPQRHIAPGKLCEIGRFRHGAQYKPGFVNPSRLRKTAS